MNEHPILFSGPMVRAILEERKTQTRRVIKPQPKHGKPFQIRTVRYWYNENPHNTGPLFSYSWLCPYGQPGDLLWVRETWMYGSLADPGAVKYRATVKDVEGYDKYFKWIPSIHMFKKYARLWLRITNVRVERVKNISQEDAKAEGVYQYWANCCDTDKWPQGWPEDAYNPEIGALSSTEVFAFLWDSLNAKRGYGWDQNPFVWVVEFERYEKTND